MDRVSLKLLARELNVSVSTVSRGLNDCHSISSGTKERILALASKLNYQPDHYAIGLKKGSSKTIAVILPEIENSFFSSSINGINSIAEKYGFQVIIYLTHESFEREVSIIKQLLNGSVDGILMSLSNNTSNTDHLLSIKSQIPLVLFDRVCFDSSFPKIVTDDFESGYKATKHLIDLGSVNLLYLGVSPGLSTDKQRKEGFLKAADDNNVNHDVLYCNQETEDLNIELLLSKVSTGRFDGVFASVESLALLCYNVLEKLNLQIPKDVKVIAFSNSKVSHLLKPSLSTITQPAQKMGIEAAEMLFSKLNANLESPSKTLCIDSTLIVRESTAGKLKSGY